MDIFLGHIFSVCTFHQLSFRAVENLTSLIREIWAPTSQAPVEPSCQSDVPSTTHIQLTPKPFLAVTEDASPTRPRYKIKLPAMDDEHTLETLILIGKGSDQLN